MHFSIPDTEEFIDGSGNAYLGYNVHINGLFHCTVRYKQLLNLHEQLVKETDISLPAFPPKKLFPLTISQQEDRRLSLEKYIQTIGQNSAINRSELLNGFLLNAQQETEGQTSMDENLDIFLMNGYKISITASTREHSGQILRKACRHIELPDQYDSYFSLFIMNRKGDDSIHVLRKLQDFESPIITQRNMRMTTAKVMLGKSYWDTGYDLELMHDPVALNLLYVQAVAEIDRGWIPVTEELQSHLASLQASGLKSEYLEIARSLKCYGCIQFTPCIADYPRPGTRALVIIGKNELILRIFGMDEGCEAVFKVTRMRCWRITTLQNAMDSCEENEDYTLELSFEYLMAKDQLQWITISSEQAILMSVCIQSMIDELLLKNVGGSKNQERSRKTWIYLKRDGNSEIIMTSSSIPSANKTEENHEADCPAKPEPIMRKLTERLSAVAVKKSSDVKSTTSKFDRKNKVCDTSLENNAFHMIGDDDL